VERSDGDDLALVRMIVLLWLRAIYLKTYANHRW